MRFDRMFDDLEHRFAHLEDEELRAQAEELTRAERAEIALVDRLRAAQGERIVLVLASGARLSGDAGETGEDWCALTGRDAAPRAIVRLGAVAVIEGLTPRARPRPAGPVAARSFRSALRAVARDRALVRVRTSAGAQTGRIVQVGGDAVDLRGTPTGERSDRGTGNRLTIPLHAIESLEVL